MTILEHFPLAPYTTFKIGGPARFFCAVTNEAELIQALTFAREKKLAVFVLGGGSNILISDAGFDGLVIKIELIGLELAEIGNNDASNAEKNVDTSATLDGNLDAKKVILSVGAGENWDATVAYAVEQGLYGLENLSAIPGSVGATPVQNIGAYGAEVSSVIGSVSALDTQAMEVVRLSNAECDFSYRNSIFKKERGRYVILRVYFKLARNGKVNTEYKDVQDYFAKIGKTNPTLAEVRAAVTEIRRNKLPDLKEWGTAGSFFKNPIISAEKFAELKVRYVEIPGFPESDGRVKVSLGWILDKVCNAKGLCIENACVYEKQALVLVGKPGVTAEEINVLAEQLVKQVKEKTGIEIEREVEWVS
jgi:UDP-N-acetylmuramate dehydrogenase